jgi:hypothetical protein
MSWQKVQRRIAQLIQQGMFYTEEERQHQSNLEAETRVDEMLAAAERIAAESAVEPYERFAVVETDEGYAIWDDLHDDYYVDEDGVTESFTSEWQAEAYLEEVRKAVADREAAEWRYVEQAKIIPEVSDERREQIISAMSAAGIFYDEIDSYEGHYVFREEGGTPYEFADLHDVVDWLNGVVFDDPARNEAAERILYPERYQQTNDNLREWAESIEREYRATIDALPEEHRRVVEAMETMGLKLQINNHPWFDSETVVFTPIDFDHGYPSSFSSWEEAFKWLDEAPFDKAPGLRDKVQSILHPQEPDKFPYSVGDTVYLEDGKAFLVEEITDMHIQLRDPTLYYPIWRSESRESFERLMQRFPQPEKPTTHQPETRVETVAVYPAEENNLPYDIVIQTLHTEPERTPPKIDQQPTNFRIEDESLGVGGPKVKFRANIDAIRT